MISPYSRRGDTSPESAGTAVDRFRNVSADSELPDDLVDDFWLARTLVEEFENARSDEVEIEHLALPDIQDNGAILAVGAANTF